MKININLKTLFIICLIFLLSVIAIYILFTKEDSVNDSVNFENGYQIIQIDVKNGYNPKNIVAKSDTPTKLRFITNKTFDCSTALVIQDLDYNKILPNTGTTDIDIPSQLKGSIINGQCSMGMYKFKIRFE